MVTTPHFSILLPEEGSDENHQRINDAFDLLDAFAQLSVISRTQTAQPGSPNEGDRYLLPGAPTGTDWSGHGDELAFYYQGEWIFRVVKEGWRVWLEDEMLFVVYDGSSYLELGQGSTGEAPEHQIAYKTADQAITFDNTPTADADLRIAINSGVDPDEIMADTGIHEDWIIHATLFHANVSTGNPGLRVGWVTDSLSGFGFTSSEWTAQNHALQGYFADAEAAYFDNTSGSVDDQCMSMFGHFRNASPGVTYIAITWSQVNSASQATTLRKGSFLRAYKSQEQTTGVPG